MSTKLSDYMGYLFRLSQTGILDSRQKFLPDNFRKLLGTKLKFSTTFSPPDGWSVREDYSDTRGYVASVCALEWKCDWSKHLKLAEFCL